MISTSHSVLDMVLCFLLLNYILQFLSFDVEPDVEIEYWEESDSELQ